MTPPPACQMLAVVAAACAALATTSCKTTSATWRREEIGTSWEKRTKEKASLAMEQINAAAEGDDSEGYMSNEFDQGKLVKSKSNLFGKKFAEDKAFRTKDFAGANEYKSGDYHFLKRQDFPDEAARDQDKTFAAADTQTTDTKRRFFWQRKQAPTKDFADNNKSVRTSSYRDTAADIERLKRREPTIVEDPARQAGATMTIDDVRTLLQGSGE